MNDVAPYPARLVADAVRNVTAKVQKEIDSGRRSARVDANDIVEILLSIADELEKPK